MTRLLTIMGSGETAPTMVKPHREMFERLDASGLVPASGLAAAVLDTPFGFQENAPELSQKTVEYFRTSLRREVVPVGLLRVETMSAVEKERSFAAVRAAQFVFAGPGSPTYALRQWQQTPVPSLLAEKLRTGGSVTFASAAALTLGIRTVPVYEVYKAGSDPYWLEGLDLLSELGLPVAVIPHYNNAEGGHHDTRFCYMGERRLRMLEAELPDGAFVLGVDEHTGVVLDLDADTATVVGLGVLTVRRDGVSTEIPSGETVSIDVLRNGPSAGGSHAPVASAPVTPEAVAVPAAGVSLGADIDRLDAEFSAALERRDADAAVAATLALDEAMVAWSTDSLQSDEMDRARALLRSMVVRLGEATRRGLVDPREIIAPFVDVAVAVRAEVRAAKRYDLSDQIRDGLAAAGVEVRDTPAGQEWGLLEG
ncbi:MAG: hypothetical protein ACO3AV_10965 [Ilumatobacteraceae bacterium]